MTAQEAKQKMDGALDRLVEQLEMGRSEALTSYLKTMSRFHRYSWGNMLLIWSQNPEATLVAGFHRWLGIGRVVKKGEKGLMILAPRQGKKTIQTDNGEEETSVTYFAPCYVFDYSQTEGDPLPEPNRVGGDPGELMDRLTGYITDDCGIRLVETEMMPAGCQGASSNGKIEVRGSLERAHKFSVLVHELGHELLHWNIPVEERRDKTRVETEAETVSFIVCEVIGLDTNRAAPDYLTLYGGNKAILRDSLERIQKAADRILKGIGVTETLPPTPHRPEGGTPDPKSRTRKAAGKGKAGSGRKLAVLTPGK